MLNAQKLYQNQNVFKSPTICYYKRLGPAKTLKVDFFYQLKKTIQRCCDHFKCTLNTDITLAKFYLTKKIKKNNLMVDNYITCV